MGHIHAQSVLKAIAAWEHDAQYSQLPVPRLIGKLTRGMPSAAPELAAWKVCSSRWLCCGPGSKLLASQW